MTVMPHNHNMWAAIGIYTGREDNILWRRVPDEPSGRIDAAGPRHSANAMFYPWAAILFIL